jgi:general secretion pathway protein A
MGLWYKTLMDVPVFSISPNPTCMYLTQPLKEAVVRFRRAIARKQGLCCILGGNGMGKSSLLRYLSSGYESDEQCSVSYFADTRKFKTPFDFLKMTSADFGISPKRSQTAQMDAIEEFLGNNHEAGKTTLIFIDEGQRLNLDTLELVRALLNYETNTEKLVQIIISGQLELRDRLLERRYKAFRSRIVAPLVMQSMTAEETAAMIAFRLDGWGLENPFAPKAILRIHELSGGVPRNILLLCQQAYDKAQDQGRGLVEVADAESAHRTLQITDPETIAELTTV